MHAYDSVLKSLFTGSRNSLLAHLIGARRCRWLNVELPRVTQLRVDLLFEVLSTLEIVSIEFLSKNDPTLPFRMLAYAVSVHHAYGRYPRQIVIYVGNEPLRMPSQLVTPFLNCTYTIIDIRDWEAEKFLRSDDPADAVLAILGRHSERPETIRRILRRIAKMNVRERKAALTKLFFLAKLRRLTQAVEKEAERMPIDLDIMDHEIFGPILRKRSAEATEQGLAKGMRRGIQQGRQLGLQQGIEKGIQKGLQKGLQQGRTKEALAMVERLITTKFGPVSTVNKRRLAKLTLTELEDLAPRILSAKTLKDLFEQ